MTRKGTSKLPSNKKKTRQGHGKYSKISHPGGESFHNGHRAGSTPGSRHQRKKPRRGQGK